MIVIERASEFIENHFWQPRAAARRTFWLSLGCQLGCQTGAEAAYQGSRTPLDLACLVEARRIELPNLLHAMQALYQLSYAPNRVRQP